MGDAACRDRVGAGISCLPAGGVRGALRYGDSYLVLKAARWVGERPARAHEGFSWMDAEKVPYNIYIYIY